MSIIDLAFDDDDDDIAVSSLATRENSIHSISNSGTRLALNSFIPPPPHPLIKEDSCDHHFTGQDDL